MKKKVIYLFSTALFAVGMFFNVSRDLVKDDISVLNVKLLVEQATAFGEDGDTVVNGPGQSYKCPGVFSGTGLDCMASNPYSCKPRSC